ncbi:hypothetical protein [Hoeflea sp.]|uniref:hypothetical protein n=1 Tax=Hoeflea sp. TaxID=1940281 RepID=UPI002AFEBA6B|nr:hypothetical protein [Hoeflea sp.]
MQPKRYALTRIGEVEENRRAYFRRDTNFPVIVHVRRFNADNRTAVPSWMVNISEDGCLITSDYFPARADDVYIIIPGLGSKVHGVVRSQGEYTLNIKFKTLLTTDVVSTVTRINPVPKN